MDINNKARIHWACRRGMRELDKMIMPFYQEYFDSLTDVQQQTFVEMLSYTDPELFRWFMNQDTPPTEALQEMVNLIRSKLAY